MTSRIVLNSLSDYPEVSISTGDTLFNRTGTWRFIEPSFSPRPSPCSTGCPLENNIPDIMSRVLSGDLRGAWEALAWEDPFPALLGRVCPGFCARDCNRREFDEPVSMRDIERFLGDRFMGDRPPCEPHPASGRGVGIIGAGPAGLSAAYFLTLLGHTVTVFEREARPGGVPYIGIPPYRLPRSVLGAVVNGLRNLGVAVETGRAIGNDESAGLCRNFDAVFVATGAHVSGRMGIAGEDLPGVVSGLSFLREFAGGTVVASGGEWLVVGGGNTALDAARVLLRLGGRPTIVYRRGEGDMPAFSDEIEEAYEERVPMQFYRTPVKIEPGTKKKLSVTLIDMKPGDPDASGRPRPVPVPGSETTIEVDGLITAVGEQIGDLPIAANQSVSGTVVIVGGDAAGGIRTVAHAAASGKEAAIRIDRRLSYKTDVSDAPYSGGFHDYVSGRSRIVARPVSFSEVNTAYFEKSPRVSPKKRPPAIRIGGFDEITSTIDEDDARKEAGRCFVCGSCIGCEVCAEFCPDFSIHVDDTAAVIDYTYCKGCGICARECPRGVIVMGREE